MINPHSQFLGTVDYIYKSRYDFKHISKVVIAHAKDGGIVRVPVIAGLLEVSKKTIYQWKKEHTEFEDLLDIAHAISQLATDKLHLKGAKNKNMNAAILNRRAEHILNMTQKVEQEITTREMSVEEIDEELKQLEADIIDSE